MSRGTWGQSSQAFKGTQVHRWETEFQFGEAFQLVKSISDLWTQGQSSKTTLTLWRLNTSLDFLKTGGLTQRSKQISTGMLRDFENGLSFTILLRTNSLSSKCHRLSLRTNQVHGQIDPGAKQKSSRLLFLSFLRLILYFHHLSEVLHVQVLLWHRPLSGAQLPWQCLRNRTSPTHINRRHNK